jgi:WD40 repeat protein
VPDDGRPPKPDAPGHTTAPRTMVVPQGGALSERAAVQATVRPAAGEPVPGYAPPPMPTAWRYEIRGEIARGGMGRVVEATDTVLGREVALKEALSLDPETVRRFERETRITAKLEHPSIVPVHDAGTSPAGAPFYVMRKVSGRPLEDLVATNERIVDRLALVPHIVAAANAIAHAHERGVVHRDIKPSNILVGDLGETIVIDWGLAKAIGETEERTAPSQAITAPVAIADDGLKTRAGIVFGTPGFMAPEQLRGAPVDERCDVYALGATLYHLLARRPPHYSKQADEMMKAAIASPPESLRTIVPGMPPELATIVDKALAHDARARYQDARALAEDLQRFLTGQLVASHHYSPRERLVRFVRRNRAIVAVSTAAVLALVTGGTFAIAHIVNERDRADEFARVAIREREEVTRSLQELKLTTARSQRENDPTRAVAMLQTLAMPQVWRQARAIAAAARLHGVAYSLPASPHTLSLELSRDGRRALAAGDDGRVRVFELAGHGAREIANVKAPTMARYADDERAIVVYRGSRLTIVDAQTGAPRELATPTAIAKLAVSGPVAFWADDAGAVWRLDVTRGDPEKVTVVGERVDALATSPDGRWIALAGADHVLSLDRTQPTLPPQELAVGRAHDLSWSADSAHLVALVDQDVLAFEMPTGTIVHRQYAGDRYAVAYSDDQIFTTARTGVTIVARGEPRARKLNGDYTLGLHEARGGTLVTGGPQGVVAVITPDDDQVVHTPQLRLTRVETSPHSPWIVGATDDRLLVWDLDQIEPRRIDQTTVEGAAFVTGDELVVTYADQPAQWIDLRTGAARPLGTIAEGLRALVPAPDGTKALLVDGTRHARMLAPGESMQDVGDAVELAVFASGEPVLATSSGEIRKAGAVLATHPAGVAALASSGHWVAATFADRTLWRVDLASGRNGSVELPAAPIRGALAVTETGRVVTANGATVLVWEGGAPTKLAAFDKPVAAVALIGATQVLAITTDGTAHAIELTGSVGAAMSNISPHASVAPVGLAASATPDGVLEVIDVAAGERWTIAAPKSGAFGSAQISPDGRRVLATTSSGVRVWTLALPDNPGATASWLAGLTNWR